MLTVTIAALLAWQPPDEPSPRPEAAPLRPDIAWAGVLPEEKLRAAAPAGGVITNPKDFEALWEAWRPGEKQPEIDFAKTVIIVGTIDGPNRMFVSLSNDAGNLKTQFGGTKVGGAGFGYLIAAVQREGIDRVNDRPLPKATVEPPAKPANEPEHPLAKPADASTKSPARPSDRQKPQRRTRPAPPKAEPDERPAPRGRESIRVAVRGPLEVGVAAIGGETTGTVIRSKGLMFEVEFTRPGLQERAEALNGQMALVAGELVVKEGVETGARLIIEAERVDLVRPSGR
jgi:hypothetical protein